MTSRHGILSLLTAMLLSACQPTAFSRRSMDKEGSFLGKEDSRGSTTAFEKVGTVSGSPQEKALAYVGLGWSTLREGDAYGALRFFYEARATYHEGRQAPQTNRAIGHAYFAAGEYGLARRYLHKGFAANAGSEEANADLALLVVASFHMDDANAAKDYRARMTMPISPEVGEILGATSTARSREGRTRKETVARQPVFPERKAADLRPAGPPLRLEAASPGNPSRPVIPQRRFVKIAVGFVTCVGYTHTSPAPWPFGNCFSLYMLTPEEWDEMQRVKNWSLLTSSSEFVANMHHENFEELAKRLGLETIEVESIGHDTCLVVDARIPREWLRSEPCSCVSREVREECLTAFPDRFRKSTPGSR